MFPWMCAHAVQSNLPKLKLSVLSFTNLLAEAEDIFKMSYYLPLPLLHKLHIVSACGACMFIIYESVCIWSF